MDFMTFVYGGYVLAAIVVAVLAIRILYRDSKERNQEQEQAHDDQIRLAAISAKAHRHVIEEKEKTRTAFGELPTIEVTVEEHGSWYDAELAKRARDEAVSRALDNVIVPK